MVCIFGKMLHKSRIYGFFDSLGLVKASYLFTDFRRTVFISSHQSLMVCVGPAYAVTGAVTFLSMKTVYECTFIHS